MESIENKEIILEKGPKVFPKKQRVSQKKIWYLSALIFWIQKGLSQIVFVFY